jgi:AmmeMemoRadiSam system protein B
MNCIAGETFSRVVVIGPSHHVAMANVASIPVATHMETPLGRVPLDVSLIEKLRRYPPFRHIPFAHLREHSVQIQVPLLQEALGEFRLVPIVVGQLDLATTRAMAAILRGVIDAKTLVVASTDFTHYGPRFSYRPFSTDIPANLRRLDLGAYDAIKARDEEALARYIETTGATICGRCAVGVLLAMVDEETGVSLLKYDTSGRISGSYANSVSYLSAAFTGTWSAADEVPIPEALMPLSQSDRQRLLDLARKTLAHALEHRDFAAPEQIGVEITEPLTRPCGGGHGAGRAVRPARPTLRPRAQGRAGRGDALDLGADRAGTGGVV